MMVVGEVFMLSVDAKPGNALGTIEFISSDAGIVSVNRAGQLTAHKKGSATISVILGIRTATLIITVK
jgi:uncharacterized protein YjdB